MRELAAIGMIALTANVIAAIVIALFQSHTERQDWQRREAEMIAGGVVAR